MKDYTQLTGIYFAHNIEDNNFSYMVIFGYNINGAFIAIPNWNVCIEVSDYLENYNCNKLVAAGLNPSSASTVSSYINTWLNNNYEQVENIRNNHQTLVAEYLRGCIPTAT